MNRLVMLVVGLTVVATSRGALAEGISKEGCIDAHSRAQDARDQGKLSLARKLFLSCAQPTCPALIQSDCAQFADELGRQQPSVSFVARDGAGNDLPDTTVYVDGVLVATRLDDGTPHDADPGKHTVKFSHGGRERVITVVLTSGEKERRVVATFASHATSKTASADSSLTPAARAPSRPRAVRHPFGAKLLMVAGGVAVLAGSALTVYGWSSVPSACSLGDHRCNGAPGDPVYDDASQAAGRVNTGMVVSAVGAAALLGGAVWYFGSGSVEAEPRLSISPWLGPDGGGLAVRGHL